MSPVRKHACQGFTLIEMLVSLAILGMVATMLVAGLSQTASFVRRTNTREATLDDVVSAQILLRGRLERLRAVPRLDSSAPLVDARGNDSNFSFFAPPPDNNQPDALQRYRLILNPTGDLVLYYANSLNDRIDLNAKNLIGWKEIPLLHNVASLTISYFGATSGLGSVGWQNSWLDRPQPPELVRISVKFPSGDSRVWPDLIARPRVTINSACRIDPLTGRCTQN